MLQRTIHKHLHQRSACLWRLHAFEACFSPP
jgi:hypothetical protein